MLMTLAFSEERCAAHAYRNKIIQFTLALLYLLYLVWNEAAQNIFKNEAISGTTRHGLAQHFADQVQGSQEEEERKRE